jgi:LPXTG-motif cell wall-anchored protein
LKELRHTFALGAMILMIASPAAAQFTTVVAPPKRPAVTATVVTDPTPRDTGRRATLQVMSAWVDSVAGKAASGAQVVDSVNGDVVVPSEPAAATERFTDGARAPNTASALPTLLLAGLAAMVTGAALLATRRRAA